MIRFILFIVFFLPIVSLSAQNEDDYYDDDHIRYDDYVYSNNFKSVQLFKTGFELAKPIISLGSKETLTLTFDDLNAESETYYYTFILCNADWTPADLLSMEYIDGINEEYFNSSTASFNTTTRYTNYRVKLPSENIKFTKSGNYLLKIYSDDDPDKPLITKRMYVVESKVGVDANCFMAKSPHYSRTHHEIFVKVKTSGYPMPNVYENFTMIIQQNGRKDNQIVKHRPKIMTDEYMQFNTSNDILFAAGNEFRVFDIRSLKVQSARVNTITYTKKGYQIGLLTDGSRANRRYLKYRELNGEYVVIDWDDPHFSNQIEADYAYVNFNFRVDSLIKNGGVYILGALTNWRIDNSSRLTYDKLTGLYSTTLLLKQGYYDYQFVYVPNGSKRAFTAQFEGNYSETGNRYTIYIYYRDQGEYWDKLIGYKTINAK